MGKYVVVTGTSTGIGYAIAQELLQQGYHVFGSVRKPEDGERLRAELASECFTPLFFDVTDARAVHAAADQVAQIVGDQGLAGLVNNAGIVVPGPLQHITMEEARQQFDVNVFGVLEVTQAFLPLLGARKPCLHPPGRIVNISSVSGRMAYPFLGLYAASKHALEAINDSLRRELMLYGIDVISIQPGTIRTNIWRKAEAVDMERLAQTDYYAVGKRMATYSISMGKNARSPEVVAKRVRHALEALHPRPHLALPDSAIGWWIMRALPVRWLDWLMAQRLGIGR
ncbi:MAG: SDR family oxidoreductase [Caldilineaceae bacterium]